MGLASFISILEKRKLHFSRLDKLKDPHEGSYTKLHMENWKDLCQRIKIEKPQSPYTMLRNINSKTAFVSCWSMNEVESEAMWLLYSGKEEGVAIKSSYLKLKKSIEKLECVEIGKITYIDYDLDSFPEGNTFFSIMHKRKAFEHEKEVRLVKCRYDLIQENEVPEFEAIDIDINFVIDGIFINPYSPEWYAESVRAVINKFCPDLSPKVKWSSMRAEPIY